MDTKEWRAHELGVAAFERGIYAPIHDKQYMQEFPMAGKKVGESLPFLRAWNRGNTEARLKSGTYLDALREKEKGNE